METGAITASLEHENNVLRSLIENFKMQTIESLARIEYMRKLKKRKVLQNKILKQRLLRLVNLALIKKAYRDLVVPEDSLDPNN